MRNYLSREEIAGSYRTENGTIQPFDIPMFKGNSPTGLE
jgi:hypothetical protein